MPPALNPLEFWLTLGVFLACAGIVGSMAWLERRPRHSFEPRLLPTTPVLLVFGFFGLWPSCICSTFMAYTPVAEPGFEL